MESSGPGDSNGGIYFIISALLGPLMGHKKVVHNMDCPIKGQDSGAAVFSLTKWLEFRAQILINQVVT